MAKLILVPFFENPSNSFKNLKTKWKYEPNLISLSLIIPKIDMIRGRIIYLKGIKLVYLFLKYYYFLLGTVYVFIIIIV